MKISFDLDKDLYDKITKNAKENGRSDSAEIRFQLTKFYKENKN